MTDKKIINGVDVSGCKSYLGMGACGAGKNHESSCMYNKNCAFKQSARKDERIRALEEQNKIYEEALKFYADEESWCEFPKGYDRRELPPHFVDSECEKDDGTIARQALDKGGCA